MSTERISQMSEKELENLYNRIGNTLKMASESPYESERETAMKLAQKMMMEYSISMDEIQAKTGNAQKLEAVREYVEILDKESQWWVKDLYWSLGKHFRCQGVFVPKMNSEYGSMGLYGLRGDVQICTEICKFAILSIKYFSECYVVNEVNRLNNLPMKDRPPIYQKWVKLKDFKGAKNDYIKGYIKGLSIAFTKQEEENKQEWGLVIVMHDVVKKFIKDQNFKTAKRSKVSTSGDEEHYRKGKKDGASYVHKKAMIEE